jgi:hypothetical protein
MASDLLSDYHLRRLGIRFPEIRRRIKEIQSGSSPDLPTVGLHSRTAGWVREQHGSDYELVYRAAHLAYPRLGSERVLALMHCAVDYIYRPQITRELSHPDDYKHN